MKVSELQGAALDQALCWAVAKGEGIELTNYSGNLIIRYDGDRWQPTTNWAQGGPIIERERIELWGDGDEGWIAYDNLNPEQKGPTPLIAAMRCYVASRLGDEVEVPNELMEV